MIGARGPHMYARAPSGPGDSGGPSPKGESDAIVLPSTPSPSGRIAPCHCGSGLRFKNCCGRLDTGAAESQAKRQRLDELVTLLNAGRYVELEQAAHQALATDSSSGVVWQLLAAAETRRGKDSVESSRKAAELLPGDAVAQVNLGNALGRRGLVLDAEASFLEAIRLDASCVPAHINLAECLYERGHYEAALQACRRALELDARDAKAQVQHGRILVRLGRYREAIDNFRRALAISPDDGDARNGLGAALLAIGEFNEAIATLRSLTSRQPAYAAAHANLGNALRSTGELESAQQSYARAVQIQPRNAQALVELATTQRLLRRIEDARASCRRALAAEPSSAAAVVVLAELEADTGDFAEAERLFRLAIGKDSGSTDAWSGIPRVRRMTAADTDWIAGASRLASSGLPAARELVLQYAIGKYHDDLGSYDEAFDSFRRANELERSARRPYDRRGMERAVDGLIAYHTRSLFDSPMRLAAPGERAVFVVGMPRSGTTLAEQILASHPLICGAGEQAFWINECGPALAHPGALASRAREAELPMLADRYRALLERLSADAHRIVDKMPSNFLVLGFIRMALPAARVIHMRRDPRDTCLSIYFQHLDAAHGYANDLGDLAHYFRQYERLMRHWRATFPADQLLEVDYEELVKAPEEWSRHMVEFVGLPWDERCLDHRRGSDAVVTASKWQVRQPVFSRSVGRWRNYRRFLGPLDSLVGSDAS